jgi:hypothetical protein
MVNVRFSLYRVEPIGDRLVTESGADFDAANYSRFKYGDGVLAEQYGRELAARLLSAAPQCAAKGEPVVIASAPYKYLPTASHELALQVGRVINAALAANGQRTVEIGALRMSRVDSTNYAKLDTVLRSETLAQAKLYVDPAEFAGRHVLLVDDARITGLAETAATELVTAAGARSVTSLYVVQIVKNRARIRPDIEDRINHAFVRDLATLLEVFRSARFVLNIRTVKYVLGWPDRAEQDAFFARLTDAERSAIHDAARRTGPTFTRCYLEPLRRLRAASGRGSASGAGRGKLAAAGGPAPGSDGVPGSSDV